MNKAISQLDSASDLQNNDLLLISQLQANGTFKTNKITADKLKGLSAYQIWQVTQVSQDQYLTQNTIQHIINVSQQPQQTFVNNTNLQNVYNAWKVEQVRNVTELYYLQTVTLDVLYANTTYAFQEFITLVNITNELQNFEDNTSTLYVIFLKQTNNYQAYINSGGDGSLISIENYMEVNNLFFQFNSWMPPTDPAIVAEYFYKKYTAAYAYEMWKLLNPNSTTQQFLALLNSTAAFNTWKQNTLNSIDVSLEKFLQTVGALQAYNAWKATQVNQSIDAFLTAFNLQANFNNWMKSKLDLFTEDEFLESLKGKNGVDGKNSSDSGEFWIVANYMNDDDQSSGSVGGGSFGDSQMTEFAALMLPSGIKIKLDDNHVAYAEQSMIVTPPMVS